MSTGDGTINGRPHRARSPARVRLASTWTDYASLLKPRIMALAVFTAWTGMLAAQVHLRAANAIVAMVCIALGAGGAGALNMACDADIDRLMRRTRSRAVPSGRVRRQDAALFGAALSLVSTAAMASFVNLLAAAALGFTIAFYAGVYTLWLKRTTPQNIVIGGLAGALPPLVGWIAAAGSISLNAWILVTIIFVWTPPHFWSLSLYNSDDYARAGIPMLPVVKGAAHTRAQILAYSLVLAPLGLAPAFTGLAGPLCLVVAGSGGAVLLGLSIKLALSGAGDPAASGNAKPSTQPARALFKFTILYLFLLFATIAVERLVGAAAFPAPGWDRRVAASSAESPRTPLPALRICVASAGGPKAAAYKGHPS
jgi:protoheme IX farnesyltransferase